MSDLKKIGEMVVQEAAQRTVQSVVNNPQAALATGVAAAKVVGGAVIVAAPYVAAVAVGGAIGWGAAKIITSLFD